MEYQSYSHYERGRYVFTVEQLFQLADLFHRPVEWFLGLKTDLDEDEQQALTLYRQAKAQGLADLAHSTLEAIVRSAAGRS
jgi:transcriptional regulator with XRE-family HTH domain